MQRLEAVNLAFYRPFAKSKETKNSKHNFSGF